MKVHTCLFFGVIQAHRAVQEPKINTLEVFPPYFLEDGMKGRQLQRRLKEAESEDAEVEDDEFYENIKEDVEIPEVNGSDGVKKQGLEELEEDIQKMQRQMRKNLRREKKEKKKLRRKA